jgi:hypothetical protein
MRAQPDAIADSGSYAILNCAVPEPDDGHFDSCALDEPDHRTFVGSLRCTL